MALGLAGLGRMGSIYAARLLAAGFPLQIWNRSPDKLKSLVEKGATARTTAAALADVSDVIFLSLADETAADAVYRGRDGLLASDLKGKTIVETSTFGHGYALALAAEVARRGGRFVDAPVLGTTGPAREGKLIVVAGGDADVIAAVTPVLNILARRIVHGGPSGSGIAMKLMINMHLCTYWHSLAESLAMGEQSGLSFELMLDVLADSSIATAALRAKMPILSGQSHEVAFDIAGVCKDLRASLDLASATGTDALAARAAFQGFDEARADGWRDRDVAEIVHAVAERTRAAAIVPKVEV